MGETGLSVALAGHYGIPVVLVAGDDKVGREARELFGTVEKAEVKEAISHYSASCLTPKESGERIKETAKRALTLDAEPYRPEPLVKFEVEFTSPDMASLASTVPGVVREGTRRTSYTAEGVLKCWSVVFPSMRARRSRGRERPYFSSMKSTTLPSWVSL